MIGGGSNPRLILKENVGSGSPGFGIEWRNRELEGGEAKKRKNEMHLFIELLLYLISHTINILFHSFKTCFNSYQ